MKLEDDTPIRVKRTKAYTLSSLLIIGAFVTINIIGLLTGLMDPLTLIALFILFFTTSIIIELYSDRLADVSIEKWGKTFRKYSHLTGGIIMLFFVITSATQLSLICLSILVAFLLHEFFYVRMNIYSIYTTSLIFVGRLDRKNPPDSTDDPRPFLPTLWLLGSIAVIGLFGRDIAVAAIIAFGFGDFVSTIVGERLGKHKLPYNKSKSLEGSIAFFGITFLGVILAYYFGVWTGTNFLLTALITASVGSVFESLIPTGYWLDDNFVVPVGVSTVLFLVAFL